MRGFMLGCVHFFSFLLSFFVVVLFVCFCTMFSKDWSKNCCFPQQIRSSGNLASCLLKLYHLSCPCPHAHTGAYFAQEKLFLTEDSYNIFWLCFPASSLLPEPPHCLPILLLIHFMERRGSFLCRHHGYFDLFKIITIFLSNRLPAVYGQFVIHIPTQFSLCKTFECDTSIPGKPNFK